MNMRYTTVGRQRGVSLIELMVALLIGFLLALGIVQIFGASRTTYQVQEGLSRVQESGRFAVQFLERQLRMVGYMGCGSDAERASQRSFVNHLAAYSAAVSGGDAVLDKYRFQRPVEAFAAAAVPAYLTAAGVDPAAGTDVLVLRVLSDDSVPVVSANTLAPANLQLALTVSDGSADVFRGTDGAPVLYALQSCRSADVFSGVQTASSTSMLVIGNAAPNQYLDPTVTTCGGGGCPWDFRISNAFLNAPAGAGGGLQLNAEIHRAEFYAFWVNDADPPALEMIRFNRNGPAGGADLHAPEELAEGVENFQVRFGVDDNVPADGQVDRYLTADEVAAGAAGAALDQNWRKVVSVRVGMLVRSPDRAAVPADAGRTYHVLDTDVAEPGGGYMRQVYETTIALRNRIFNS